MCGTIQKTWAIIPFVLLFQGSIVCGNDAARAHEIHVIEWDTLELFCSVTNVQADTESVTWFFQRLPFFLRLEYNNDNGTIREYEDGLNYTLQIVRVTRQVAENFVCHKQQHNHINRTYLHVVVHGTEGQSCDNVSTYERNSYYARKFEEALLLCGMGCVPNSSVIWINEGWSADITNDENVFIKNLTQASVLVITSLHSYHYSNYTCINGKSRMRILFEGNMNTVVTFAKIIHNSSWATTKLESNTIPVTVITASFGTVNKTDNIKVSKILKTEKENPESECSYLYLIMPICIILLPFGAFSFCFYYFWDNLTAVLVSVFRSESQVVATKHHELVSNIC